jgi:hypothetical protein
MGAAEGGEADAEHAALAVAHPYLHLGAVVRAGEDESLSDEGLVEGVGAVAPGFAGLAEERRDAAAGGLRQKEGVFLVEPADGLDVVGAGRGALLHQSHTTLLEQGSENAHEPLRGLKVPQDRPLNLAYSTEGLLGDGP